MLESRVRRDATRLKHHGNAQGRSIPASQLPMPSGSHKGNRARQQSLTAQADLSLLPTEQFPAFSFSATGLTGAYRVPRQPLIGYRYTAATSRE